MKIRTLLIMLITGLFVSNSFAGHTGFQLILDQDQDQHYSITQNRSHFSIDDATKLSDLVKDKSVPYTSRLKAVNVLSDFDKSLLLGYFKDIENSLLNNIALFSAQETDWENSINRKLLEEADVLYHTFQSIGKIDSDHARKFLLTEYEDRTWQQRNNLGLPDEYLEEFVKIKLFRALCLAATKEPSLFDTLEQILSNYQGMIRISRESIWIEHREKYFHEHPDQLPENGYFFIEWDDPVQAVGHTLWRIEEYFNLTGALPEKLTDLAIPNGGTSAYLFSDLDGKQLKYYKINDDNLWTFILLSVGPNRKQDIDFSNIKLGMSHSNNYYNLKMDGDDVFEIISYYHPEE